MEDGDMIDAFLEQVRRFVTSFVLDPEGRLFIEAWRVNVNY
jgi:hypothetical protein